MDEEHKTRSLESESKSVYSEPVRDVELEALLYGVIEKLTMTELEGGPAELE